MSYGQFQQPASQPAPAYWQMPTYATQARYEPAATVAFTLALVSLVIWVLPAIVAIAMAVAARRNIRASHGRRKGNGLAVAAMIISVVELTLVALALAALLVS